MQVVARLTPEIVPFDAGGPECVPETVPFEVDVVPLAPGVGLLCPGMASLAAVLVETQRGRNFFLPALQFLVARNGPDGPASYQDSMAWDSLTSWEGVVEIINYQSTPWVEGFGCRIGC